MTGFCTPTFRYARLIGLGGVLAIGSCVRDPMVGAGPRRAALAVHASTLTSFADGTIGVDVFYRRESGELVRLDANPSTLAFARGTTITRSVEVDLAPCLADGERVNADLPGCPLVVELALRDPSGAVIDRQQVTPPARAEPGQVSHVPDVALTEVGSVSISPRSLPSLRVGEKTQLSATVRSPNGSIIGSYPTSWSTSSPAVATVNASTGEVTAAAPGAFSITATAGAKSDQLSLTVAGGVSRVTVTPSPVAVALNGTVQLSLDAVDASGARIADLTGHTLTWTTDNGQIATVSLGGVVTGAALGATNVAATVDGVRGTAPVTVGAANVTLVPPSPAVAVGATITLQATAVDARGAVIPGVSPSSWRSDNPNVATVSAAGAVTGIAAGTATVQAVVAGATGVATVQVVSPPVTRFSAAVRGSIPAPQVVQIPSSGGGPVAGLRAAITYETQQNWLAATLNANDAPATLTIVPTRTDLPPGVYAAIVRVTSTQGVGDLVFPVTYTLTDVPVLAVSSKLLEFRGSASASPPAQIVDLTNAGTGSIDGLAVSASYGPGGAGWLTAQLNKTSVPAAITVSVSTASRAPGAYTASIVVSSTTPGVAPQRIDVALEVVEADPVIGLSASTLLFEANVPDNRLEITNTIAVTNAGGGGGSGVSGLSVGDVSFGGGASNWFRVSLSSATTPSSIFVTVDLNRVSQTESGSFTVRSTNPRVAGQTVTVRFRTRSEAVVVLTPPSLTFDVTAGGALPAPQVVTATNGGESAAGPLNALSIQTSDGLSPTWLSASGSSPTLSLPMTMTVSILRTNLPVGTYTGVIRVGTQFTASKDLPVVLRVH